MEIKKQFEIANVIMLISAIIALIFMIGIGYALIHFLSKIW